MRRCTLTLLAALAFGATPAWAADPVNYKIKFAPSGDATLDSLLSQTSTLVALQKKLPPSPFALIGRAQEDLAQCLIVLHSQGYDAGSVTILIDGKALDDPGLLAHLTAAPSKPPAFVLVTAHKGAKFHIGLVTLTGLPAGVKIPANLRPGQPALAAPILDATPALTSALHNAGYAFATVSAPLAIATPATATLNVSYTIHAGPKVKIGPITFVGLKRLDPGFLRAHIALKQGQVYSDTALAAARDSLLGLGVFASVTPVPEQKPDRNGEVPILFRVQAQKRHAVTVSLSYATDAGFTVSTSWEDRNVFGHAETLTITTTATGLGGTGSTAPGYDIKGVFVKPDFWTRSQSLSVSVEGLRQFLTAYNRTALLAGVTIARPLTPHVSVSYGPGFVTENVEQEGENREYVLAQLPAMLSYNTTDSPLEPTKGINASLTLTPTEPIVGDRHPFLITQAYAATYISVEQSARGIIALRGQIGSIQGATLFNVPPDQRFYAGGSSTVRGYTYQTIGPLFPDDIPEGGDAFDAASVEFRQHVWGNFGVVPFLDAGQVSSGSEPFTGTLRVGAGLGGRYYTSIGPIRLDVALPLTRTAGSGAFALYVGLGEAF
jgi:translocation and assembly module TamA